MTPTMEEVAGWLKETAEHFRMIGEGLIDGKPLLAYAEQGKIRAAQVEAMGWRPVEEAPIGGGAESIDDPNWVEPPKLMLLFPSGTMRIGNYEWYFSEGGYGYNGLSAWADSSTGEQLEYAHGEAPTHFMPLPQPPVKR